MSGRWTSDADDSEISRCECHGAWTWRGRCTVDAEQGRRRRQDQPRPETMDDIISQFAADQAARKMGKTG